MSPGFQAIFAINRSSKALAPMMAWEMRTHFFDGGWVDEIGVCPSIIYTLYILCISLHPSKGKEKAKVSSKHIYSVQLRPTPFCTVQ